jgi:hypothetical protein
MRTHALTNPSSGNPVGEPQQFNLMFASSIGPTGQHPGCVLLWFIFSSIAFYFLLFAFASLFFFCSFLFGGGLSSISFFQSLLFLLGYGGHRCACTTDVRWHVQLADTHNSFMGISQNDDALSARR